MKTSGVCVCVCVCMCLCVCVPHISSATFVILVIETPALAAELLNVHAGQMQHNQGSGGSGGEGQSKSHL